MRTVDILIAARNLISDRAHWIKGAMERTRRDGSHCYCPLGAINAAAPTDSIMNRKARTYLNSAIFQYSGYPNSIITFNDFAATTHAMALAVFDLAIKNAKRRHVNGDRQKMTTNYCLKPKFTETV